MKKMIALIVMGAAVILSGLPQNATAQTSADLAGKFLDAAKSASDSQLGDIASELTGKIQSFTALLGSNSSVSSIKSQVDSTLKALTGGQDSAALTSAFKLASAAKLTPEQITLAKQVGNVSSAYVVRKNFASLEGSQDDVATIVKSLRNGQIAPAVPAMKNVATNAHLTDDQKQLISKVADKYAPGWKKAGAALDAIKKLPGF